MRYLLLFYCSSSREAMYTGTATVVYAMTALCTTHSRLTVANERRKELAEGKTSKVALDDCNLPSPSSRGRVPAVRR